jgi:DNA invertase Pin-like site-specific DNA recombinase
MTEGSPRLACIYCRISSDRTGAGLGVDRQEQDCRELAARLGWPVVEVFTDNDISAYSGKPRPGYKALLKAIEEGRVTAVLAWHGDRLHRSPTELEHYITVCNGDRDVPTHTVQAGPLDLSTPSGRMVARQLGAVARFESEHKAARQQRAVLQNAQAGRPQGSPRPFGFERDGITIREVEAAAVRRGIETVLAGGSLRAVAKDWNAAGLVTSMRGRPWDYSAVREVLLRPRNAGLRQHQGEILGVAVWPSIVDPDQWRAAVTILTNPGRRTNPVSDGRARYLGSGIYVCFGCGQPSLRVSTAGDWKRHHPTYRCGGPGTGHVSRAQPPLDAYVEAVIIERLRRPDVIELLRPSTPDVDLDGLRATANAARVRLTEIAEAFGDGEMSRAEMNAAKLKATARLETAEAELAAATAPTPLLGVADSPDPVAAWAGLDISRRRSVLDALMTVTVLPVPRGAPPGFDRDTVKIEWREPS